LAVFSLSLIFTFLARSKQSSYQTEINLIKHKLDQAEKLSGINKEVSRKFFVEAGRIVSELGKRGIKDKDFLLLKKSYEEKREKILSEYSANPVSFLDLSLVSKNFKGEKMILFGNQIFVLDREKRIIVSVDLDSKRTLIIAGPTQIEEVFDFVIESGETLIFKSKGVFNLDGRKVMDIEWGDFLVEEFSGSVYILDRKTSQIYKFSRVGENFSLRRNNWLKESVDLSDSASFVIDGSVWVLKREGKILKFFLGERIPWEFDNFFFENAKPILIFSQKDLDNLYILMENGRILIFDKTSAEFKAEYLFQELGKVKSLVVSEQRKTIFLLTEEGLFSIAMRHY